MDHDTCMCHMDISASSDIKLKSSGPHPGYIKCLTVFWLSSAARGSKQNLCHEAKSYTQSYEGQPESKHSIVNQNKHCSSHIMRVAITHIITRRRRRCQTFYFDLGKCSAWKECHAESGKAAGLSLSPGHMRKNPLEKKKQAKALDRVARYVTVGLPGSIFWLLDAGWADVESLKILRIMWICPIRLAKSA